MNKSTKKRISADVENVTKKIKTTDIKFNDWFNITEYKKARTALTPEGRTILELRKFDEEGRPTEAGIIFNEDEIKMFIQLIPTIESYYEAAMYLGEDIDFKQNLGHRNKFVSVNSNHLCVDMRIFFKSQNGDLHATKRGVALNLNELRKLKDFLYMLELSLYIADIE